MDIVKSQQIHEAYKSLPAAALTALVRQSRILMQELNPSAVDPLPLVVSTEDAALFQTAADQWGNLLTRAYEDLWGPQQLIADRVLDPGLLWGTLGWDPAFSHSLPRGVDPLSILRLDVIRRRGTWTLAGLGTEMPRGLGYALDTRIVHSRSFGPPVPHDNLVRLAPFFQALKDLWFHTSLTHRDEPSIMVWTSGPSDPHYFEPAYLSRYFGYPLVESRDLTVRSGKVFLKTLGGLTPVDVLVRMVPDRQIDPLAGNPGGWGGVAGLLQAVRDGTVLVTNAPGAGLLAHPGLLPAWPAVAQALLGEDLVLPPGPPELNSPDWEPGPEEFFDGKGWTPAPVAVRLFAARTGDDRTGTGSGWHLMPGGLVQRLEGNFTQDQWNGVKKDLWFLSAEAEPPVSLLPQGERPSEINRTPDLPSRVADDLFWLGRYTERAWVDLRYLEKWWELRFEAGPEHREDGGDFLDALVRSLRIVPDEAEGDEAWVQSRLAETVGAIRQVAGQVLDRMSLETHRLLRELGDLTVTEDRQVPALLRQLNLRLAAFSGLTMESMTRSPGWRFLDMGRRLERAQLVLEGVRGFFEAETGENHLGLLLDIFDSTLTYRTRYRLRPQRGPVLDLLLLDETNPRSAAFQVEALSGHVAHLPRPPQRPFASPEERTILDLLTRIRLHDGAALGPEALPPFFQALEEGLETFAEALHRTYLAKIDPMESLQSRGRGETE